MPATLPQVIGPDGATRDSIAIFAVDEDGNAAPGGAITASQLPATLGSKADALSLSVTAATDLLAVLTATKVAVESTAPVSVWAPSQLVTVTMTPDTSALASGDLIADTQVVSACFLANDTPGVLQTVMVIDESDQGAAFDIYFLDANVSMGTENAAPSISDANAANIMAIVPVLTTDYKDLGGVRVAQITNRGIPVKPATGTDDMYVAIVNGSGTPTYAASAIKLRVGVL